MPSETEIVDQLLKERNAYHQLVLALSIVGGIAGIALLTGTFIFVRMRIRKRKRKEDLEMAQSSSPSSPSPPSSPSLTFPSPTHQPRSRPPSLNDGSSRAMSEDGDMTVLNFDSDPFMDPPATPTNHKVNQMLINRSSVLPSAPTLPTHLEPHGYINYRQNQTLSMLSQTTSAAAPSAPPAKELYTIPKHENPFEDEYCCDHLDQQPSITGENIGIREHHTPIPSQSIPPSQRIPLTQSTDSFSSDLPPPAYTPCAPSAPPLYALPANIRPIEPLQHEEDSSRRHSISSCSVISSIRPLSLRRGSGSLAHISSPFS
ncbi:hypothetical protein BDF21DRAFT_418557 [Thamnidium elegans]|uniref:Uncharacterized protein n=1 Tax=Thamnidium elegans TaxID=101142 RepID=A0A8H7SM69_9FUNG|nr:hypothetical protein INT48_004046 [Thamnidium elegans]KAI8081166.1 hypothetical protein BDF21DRAFT_418557 [Thamnidium elegans]